MSSRAVLYSAVGDVITRYMIDVDSATLHRMESVTVASKVQYAWPHPSGGFLYVSTSDGGPRVESHHNHVSAYSLGPDGQLNTHGLPARLPYRAVHLCIDPLGRFIVNAHNFKRGSLTVHRINADCTIGSCLPQDPNTDFGVYPHQVMFYPSAKQVLIVDRGNNATTDKLEDPGALRSFRLTEEHLQMSDVVAPNHGHDFGPRHVDFHPTHPWLYAADERTNRLYMFRHDGDRIEAEPAFTRGTLRTPEHVHPRQLAGAIHVHPSGKFVYLVNRADATHSHQGRPVFSGGENNIAVYAINPETGEPTLVQHVDTRSFHVRTFACDPSGRLLVTASIKALAAYDDEKGLTVTPATLSIFRIGDDGHLKYARSVDVETPGNQLQYWMGIVGLR